MYSPSSYTLDVLFNDWLGISHQLTQAARVDVCLSLSDQPGELHLPDSFFGRVAPPSETWLQEHSLLSLPPSASLTQWDTRELALDILLTEPLVPVLFGTGPPCLSRRTAPQGTRLDLPLDIFGSAFFMLSCYHRNENRVPDTVS